jgi:hypothetical protein
MSSEILFTADARKEKENGKPYIVTKIDGVMVAISQNEFCTECKTSSGGYVVNTKSSL